MVDSVHKAFNWSLIGRSVTRLATIVAAGAVFVTAGSGASVRADGEPRSLEPSVAVHAPAPLRAAAGIPPDQDQCQVEPDKLASPSEILLGQEVTVRLTLTGTCAGTAVEPTEVILAMDRSFSMSEEGRWPAAIAAAQGFVQLVDFPTVRVGLVTFSEGDDLFDPQGTIQLPLNEERSAVLTALGALPPPPETTLWTNLTAAIETSQQALGGSRPGARRVMILLTDGNHNALPFLVRAPEEAAVEARDAGTVIFTIGLTVDDAAATRLEAIAGAPERFFRATTPQDLENVYAAVALSLASVGIADVVVTDEFPANMVLVPGTVSPPADQSTPNTLVWRVPRVGASGWSATYRLRPTERGTHPTNVVAFGEFSEPGGARQRVEFPVPVVTVRVPVSYSTYLPAVFNHFCEPERPFDVVLAIDSSSSMDGEKAVQARAAAAAFLRILSMPPTQASVVAFHEEAVTVQELTTDRRLAESALIGLPSGTGTRIDRALDAATAELESARHRPEHLPVVILVTDGRQTGAPEQEAIDAAARARAKGVTIFAIGIGADVSAAVLQEIAGDPGRYYAAAGPGELRNIYVTIAGVLPCER